MLEGGKHGNPLHAASSEGHTVIVQSLLEKGAESNTQGGVFGNVLRAASYGGHTDTLQLLLENGSDINAQEGPFGNALPAALSECHIEAIHLVWEKAADVNAQGIFGHALRTAVKRGLLETALLLLDRGAAFDTLEAMREES